MIALRHRRALAFAGGVTNDPGVTNWGSGCRVDVPGEGGEADDPTVVFLRGELDAAAADEVRARLLELIHPGRQLVVDLGDLEFLDSSGLGVLVLALTRSRDVGARLVAANPTPRIHRLMETSKVASLFGLEGPATAEPVGAVQPADRVAVQPIRDPATLEEIRTLLIGFENLLRWGDLRPEQVTVALLGAGLAADTDDLALAARVRDALRRLGVEPPAPSPED